MSGFGTGQFDENADVHAELGRLRRQQQAAAWSALAAARQPDYAAHLGLLGVSEASSPYYARAPGYPRYAGLADPAYGARMQADQNQLAQLHHAVFGRQQPSVQQLASNYAYAPPGGTVNGYSAAATPTHRSTADQQRFPYGLASATSPAPAAYDNYASRNSYGSPPKAAPNSASSLHRQSSAASSGNGQAKSTPRAKATPGKSPAVTPSVSKATPKTPKSGSSYGSNMSKASEKSKEQNGQKRVITNAGTILVDGKETYYSGHVPLGLDDDKYWLSELQVYLRSHFAEAFGATEDDVAAPMHGRNKPIVLGQVGIRCKHCKGKKGVFRTFSDAHSEFSHLSLTGDNPAERGQQSTSYPSLISGIYNSVQQMLRLHLDCCLSIPPEVRSKIEALKVSCSSRGGRKQYWVDSAKRLGLVDTPDGIHFGRDPHGPLPPLSGPSVNSKEGRRKRMLKASAEATVASPQESEPLPAIDDRPLVFEEDRPLISDYLYLTLEQMAPCSLMEADRVGCYKTRKVGFPGLACKHCVGQAGCGRYFPASEASLSQTTTSQTIMNHVRNCRRCPTEIRENLEIMKRNRMGPDGKRADKPKHGGRKVFFHRLWCRIQGLEIDEEELKLDDNPPKRRKAYSRKSTKRKKTLDSDGESGDDATGGVSSDGESESDVESEASDEKKSKRRRPSPGKRKPDKDPWYEGCVRLTKTDDLHWLSEMECFARSDLVEVFSLGNKDELEGYNGRKEPAIGQVGIRCVFCKSLPTQDRPAGCVSFPDSLSTIHLKVTDMIRLHFPGCPSLSDEARETFKSLRGFDAKVASDDAQQYWVDAARDVGLANFPPDGRSKSSAWGITFRRDPLQPSPADELDLENSTDQREILGKNSLVRLSDRGMCTDQAMLLLRQVVPCRFKKSDRRSGPGYRGRDRSMGFPGLSCKHCAGKNTLGRYFPVSAKNMTDCTSNSLQTHVASCSHCPEPIRASLAYLGHRSILQKAELRGCWKKAFFRKIWDRLHVERKWTSTDDGTGNSGPGNLKNDEYSEDAVIEEEGKGGVSDDDGGDDDGESESDKEEELGDHMNALIKAAAIWLTEQDAVTDSARASARASKQQGRSLPSKRPTNSNSTSRARGEQSSSKRRRVHF